MKKGNVTQETEARHFERDYADRMRVFRNQSGSSQPTVYTQYFYDAGGNRVMKFTRKQDGPWEWTVYINGVFEWTQNSDDEKQSISHIMDDKSRIASKRTGDDIGDRTPAIKYNLEDHLGSSMTLLDESGGWVSWEEYYPFGETSLGSYAKKRYRFCGKERDEESGLYYYGARYYLPWLCRFASVDPLKDKFPNLTSYQYSSNNPITNFDLDGLEGVNFNIGISLGIGSTESFVKFKTSLTFNTPKIGGVVGAEGGVKFESTVYSNHFGSGGAKETMFAWYSGLAFGSAGGGQNTNYTNSGLMFAGSGQPLQSSTISLGVGQNYFKGNLNVDNYSTSQVVGAMYSNFSINNFTNKLLLTNDIRKFGFLGDDGDRLRTAMSSITTSFSANGAIFQLGLNLETQTDIPVPELFADFKGPYITDKVNKIAGPNGTYETISPSSGSINRNLIGFSGAYSGAFGSGEGKIGLSTPKLDQQKGIHNLLGIGNFMKPSEGGTYQIEINAVK